MMESLQLSKNSELHALEYNKHQSCENVLIYTDYLHKVYTVSALSNP